ncbi:MAG: SDR family oxidoreductase [Nocardioidaceae bacterium]
MPTLGLTGSTGRLGGRVARLLADREVDQRLLVRDLARAPRLPGSAPVLAPYDDREAVRSALAGVETALMVSAAESATRLEEHRAFVDAAAEAGVRHLVYTSFYGASPDATFTLARDHFHTEQHIRTSGMAWTFLRDNVYLDFLPLLAGEDGVIRGPAGDGRVAAVAQDDVAEAAAAVLLDPGAHAGTTYSLTGPEAFTLAEAASVTTAVTGREQRFEDETLEQAYASRASYGAADWQVDAWVSTYTAIRSGELAGVTDDVERLTGHPARSLEELLRADAP